MNAVETQLENPFYVTGGTLSRDALCYVARQADHQLYDCLRKGSFSYVLTARQMGKSSLMVRTASRLRDEGVGVVVLDLTAIGMNLTAEQWYGGLLTQMAQQLNLEDELEHFWDSNAGLGPLQRWMQALRRAVLPHYPERVVVFIDEIDAVRSLPFSTDEFFAGIREFYNHRTEAPELEKLSFCLLGVAAPSDLIRDTRMTPFNIGQRIELHDFAGAEAGILALGLASGEPERAQLLERILYWTGGHPYLTQRLCQALAEDTPQPAVLNTQSVDRMCADLFFARRAREQDDNLLFVRERMLRSELDLAGLLGLYAQVHSGRRVEDDETNPFVTILKLSGIARIEDSRLRVRNRIYERVFNQGWVATNMPDAEIKRQRAAYRKGLLRAAAIAAVIVIVITGLAFVALRQRNLARAAEEINRQQLYAAHMNLAARDWQDSSIEHMRELLGLQTPKPAQTDLRGFEWYLLWALAHPDRQTLNFSSASSSIGFSPDIRMYATEDEGDLKLWDMATGNQTSTFRDMGALGALEFSPDGKLLATSADNSIRLWDIASGQELRRFEAHTEPIDILIFSRDGKILASGGQDQTARLWDVGTGNLLVTLKDHAKTVNCIAFSPDLSKVATGSEDETVKLWDVATGRKLITLKEHPAKALSTPPAIWRVAFSPDGTRILATGNFISVAVWDSATGQALPSIEGHRAWINGLAFSPDGKLLATGSGDRTIRLWDAGTWSFVKSLTGHGNQVFEVAFSDDSKTLASASFDKTIKLWDVAADPNPLSRPRVNFVAYSPDGKLASAQGKELRIWDATSWTLIATFRSETAQARSLAYSPDGKFIAVGSADKTARLWEVDSGQERFVLKGHADIVQAVAFSPDGKSLATASQDKTILLWDVTTGRQLATLEGHEGGVHGIAFSPDGRLLASASLDTSIRLWDIATGREVIALRGHTSEAFEVAFSPDGSLLASASADSAIIFWDVATHRKLSTLKGHAGIIHALAFSPDGRRLASGGDDLALRLWDVASGQELAAFRRHVAPISSLGFSPDGKTLVSAGFDGRLLAWRAATTQEVLARGSQAY